MKMNIKIRFFLICIYLLGISSTNIEAQGFYKADSLFNSKKYLRSAIEYERVVFYSKDMKEVIKAKYKKALCYRNLNNHERAVGELQTINIRFVKGDLRIKIIYEKVLNLYCLERFNEALINIDKVLFFEKDPNKFKDLIPYRVLCLNSLRKWKKAKEVFVECVEGMDLDTDTKKAYLDEIEGMYGKKGVPKYYNPETAADWSRFIPGAGQFYSGHIKEGIFAMGLNASFAAIGLYHLYYEYYCTAYVFGFGMLYEAYTGGMRRVAKLAEDKNINTMTDFNRKTIALFLRIYSGDRQ